MKVQVLLKYEKSKDLRKFMMSVGILLRVRNVSDESCRKKTHFLVNNLYSENLAVCEITWKNLAEPDGPQVPI